MFPVLFWALSGLLHPIMANWFRVKPAKRMPVVQQIDTTTVNIGLQEALSITKLKTINNYGFVTIVGKVYYRFQYNDNKQIYVDAKSGVVLSDGDNIYAKQLADYYSGITNATVKRIDLVTDYNTEYKVINRYLPVYKVSYENDWDVYVHVPSGKLGTINDVFKKKYLWCFSMFHNWDFLGSNHTVKPMAILLLSIVTFVTGVLGLYIYFVNRKKYKKRKKGNQKLKQRNIHRYVSVPSSVFLLLFAFSGGYHAVQKFNPVSLNDFEPKQVFSVEHFVKDPVKELEGEVISSLSLVKINTKEYYRIVYAANKKVCYNDVLTFNPLKNGDEVYALERAKDITGEMEVKGVKPIFKFSHEYGFINKRLPVYKVDFNTKDNLTCYLETETGIPGAIITDTKRREGFSFSMLHKYHFLDKPLGKEKRDVFIAFAIVCILSVLISGLLVFLQILRKNK